MPKKTTVAISSLTAAQLATALHDRATEQLCAGILSAIRQVATPWTVVETGWPSTHFYLDKRNRLMTDIEVRWAVDCIIVEVNYLLEDARLVIVESASKKIIKDAVRGGCQPVHLRQLAGTLKNMAP